MDSVNGKEYYKPSFTVDVEDGISITMRDSFGVNIRPTDRVQKLTDRILRVYSSNGVKGTFFVLGQIAEHYPDVVRQIHSEGHELAVHGYNHLLFSNMTPEKAFQELDSAKKLIEDISGAEVIGHRAPAFSINSETKWAFDVLVECGFTYDSSVMPCKGPHYGWPEFPSILTEVETQSGHSLLEFPMSVASFAGRNIPALGGSYLRLLPYRVSRSQFRDIEKHYHPIIYIHPYELDNDRYPDYYFEELKKSGLKKNVSLRSNWLFRSTMEKKFNKLMRINGSVPMWELIQKYRDSGRIGTVKLESLVAK
jgi:polysaccharide deacetylase family protein (PEP-CTERM system associated)